METDTKTAPTPLQAWLYLQSARGLTLDEIGAMLGLSGGMVSYLRAGKRKLSRKRIAKVKIATGLTEAELLL